MSTCIEIRREAANVLDDPDASPKEVEIAKNILKQKMCSGCSNPLTYKLGLDDLMCEKQ